MAKELIRFGCASVGLLVLSACGATGPVVTPPAECTAATQAGGYWFSYTDHVRWMTDNGDFVPADHVPSSGANIEPLTGLTVSMPVVQDPAAPEHACVIHVWGSTPPQPALNDVVRGAGANPGGWFDTYYQQSNEYPNSLIVAYPVAGVGFGFKHNNAPYDPSQGGKYVGITFDMKTQGNTAPVDAQLAVVCSATNGDDLNDPTFSDAFTAPGCKYATMTTPGEDLATQGSDYNSQRLGTTCFDYEHKLITPKQNGQWNTYCVLWNELTLPNGIDSSAIASLPTWNDDTLKNCTTKFKWEMFKPPTDAAASAFDVMLDNIKFITRAQAADPARNCNASALPTDSTKLIGPAPGFDGG